MQYIKLGTCVIDANQAGNTDFSPAPQAQQTINVATRFQSITLALIADRAMKKPSFNVKAKTSSRLPVIFTTTTPTVCTASGLNGRTITLLRAGTCSVAVDQSGNATYGPADTVTRSFTVTRVDQVTTFAPITDHDMRKSSFSIRTTARSHLRVKLTSTTPAVCTLEGSDERTMTLHQAGTCTVTADQSGDNVYNPATTITRSFTVRLVDQTIKFAPIPNHSLKQGSLAVHASATSRLPVDLATTTPTVCTIGGGTGGTITLRQPGTCAITATQSGTAIYKPAPTITQTFTVTN